MSETGDFMERVKRVILARHAYLVNAQEQIAGVNTSPMSYEDWRVYELLCVELGYPCEPNLFKYAKRRPEPEDAIPW